ncbi:MAG: oxaloacetate decarboxylase subunit alpha [Erysipelotrichaceae bacterium]|nr:oxaloacetate decarboxylase subunit alpha [Erysipelotrichaceae bacterium]MBQ1300996.1 oxaloacetate decarboxylase subunit alpha [Erysipelotrichaceae bacterium]MBQ2684780.1 oxaloacetate decarboxylase subunit alpha [Erysipelotrichaceae bacterium]MBR2827237.1 oxaloacetate decarboxylase subunit alpha [Erysipelotrichaceae bacterium]
MVKIVETSVRDGHQSLFATRMTTEEVVKLCKIYDDAGFHAIEVWGGATFDACMRFLNEDPWERLRAVRAVCKKTKLQMLFRGQNILGYRHYSDDVVDMFCKKSIENGIDIIRVFDALNDIRNLEMAVKATKKYGGECQIALSYTTSPVHTIDYYVSLAKEIEQLGADSICIKDMAGVLTPEDATKLVKALKKEIKLPLELHSHSTAGVCEMTYMAAIKAGVDIVDTSMSPLSNGTAQPSTQALNIALKGTKYDPKLNLDAIHEAEPIVTEIVDKYLKNGLLNPKSFEVNPNILKYQVPGGMLSNLIKQLTDQDAMDKYEEVLREIPVVRKDLGYPPLVTPMSQMVGTQSVLNILNGERYKIVAKEVKDYLHGRYGKSPAPVNEAVRKKIIGDDEVITCRPADLLEPEFEKLKAQYADIARSDEDVLSLALFEQVATKFLTEKYNPKPEVEVEEFEMFI